MRAAALLVPLLLVLVLLLLVATCTRSPIESVTTAVEFTDAELQQIFTLSPLPAPPASPTNRVADDPHAARLGQRLFFDPRLSANGGVSCATCHDPAKGFSDGRPRARGLGDGKRHSPSLFNVGHAAWLFWDGRADSLWAQALGPLEAAVEMGASRVALWHLFTGDESLRSDYERVFGTIPALEITKLAAHGKPGDAAWEVLPPGDRTKINSLFANLGKAIEAYERRLVSTGAPFDAFVRGLREGSQELAQSLSPRAQRGLRTFLGVGQCILCHHGPNFTDGEFHNIGLPTPKGEEVDVGRYDGVDLAKASPFGGQGEFSDDRSEGANMRLAFVTKKLNNLGEFKTPSLRSVAVTAPYMHDGRFMTLADVLEFYGAMDQEPAVGHREESLRPLQLSDGQLEDLAEFLKSLTGKPLPAGLLEAPESARK